jgi:phosphoinositide-3-kinase regulatory subunit 4
MMQALRADGALPSTDPESGVGTLSASVYQNLYDSTQVDLVKQIEAHTTALLTDSDSTVRRAFLGSISTLCVFFGSTKSADVILSHLNTYLNDRDWELKVAFFETIVGVATYVGGASLEEFILPLMVQALSDPEDTVVERVLRSFSAIANLGLFQRSTTWELVDIVSRFSMHPNNWIREAAVEFVATATKYLSIADCYGIIIPMMKVYLKHRPRTLTELELLDALKPPLPRLVLEMATSWATNSDKGLFWKHSQKQRTFLFGTGRNILPPSTSKDLGPKAFGRLPKNEEDEQWIRRLANAGMTREEEFKLVALQEYIFRVARRKSQEEHRNPNPYGIIKVSDIKDNIISTVIFDKEQSVLTQSKRRNGESRQPRTITEELQDAAAEPSQRQEGRPSSRRASSSAKPNALTLPLSSPSTTQERGSQAQSPVGLDIPRPNLLMSPSSGPTVASSVDSRVSLRLGDDLHGVRRKGSAINLTGRTGTVSKATAEISTTPTNAFGQVEGRGMQSRRTSTLPIVKDDQHRHPSESRRQAAHDYSGSDPSILRRLDNLYLENYAIEYIEFGPMVAPRRLTQDSIKRAGAKTSSTSWKPEGNLVALLGEHTGPISRVVVSPDHSFFITGSDDGSVKVWDTARLERSITHRSRQTHKHAQDVRVTSLAFVENTHSFVSTGSDGSVHVVRVDYHQGREETQNLARYGKLKLVREYFVPKGDYVMWCEHFTEDNRSILLMVTNKSRIIALELRTMVTLYELQNPSRHGNPQTFCVDKDHHWILLGTSHGVLNLWDLRFQTLTKSWRFPGGSPIYRISMIPSRKAAHHKIAIAGGTGQGEVTVWNLRDVICTQAYRTGLCKDNTKGYKLVDMDEEKAGGVLLRFATAPEPSSNAGMDRGVRAMAMGVHASENSDPKFSFFVTAGPDWKVRFWDTLHPTASSIISGMELEEGRPTYTSTSQSPDLKVISERLSPPPPISGSASSAQAGSPASSKARSEKRSGREKKGSSIVSMQQQHLLKSHLDTIMDVALLEVPYGMVVSVDRMGCIYVFS